MGKHFLWDPVEDNIIEEFDDAGTTIADYTTEPYLYGELISQHRGGQSSFYHYDGQGSTTSLTDSAANVTDTYAYSAFGEVTEQTGNTVNPFQYIGQKQYYRDAETGEYEVRRRVYDKDSSRWTSVDQLNLQPLVDVVVDSNLYRYVENRPLVMIDPSGLIGVAPARTIYYCELFCASQGKVLHDVTEDTLSTPLCQIWKCNCRPIPKTSGKCTPQELAHLQVAKGIACAGAGKPKSAKQPCEVLLALLLANEACIVARQIIQTRCFPNQPDKKHDDFIKDHTDWASLALQYYTNHKPDPCVQLPPDNQA